MVCLSRARAGLLVLGDPRLLASHSPAWRQAVELLHSRGAVYTRLEVNCPRHCTTTTVHTGTDCDFPLGGCRAECGAALQCDHACSASCHSPATPHQCHALCTRLCSRGHASTGRCGEPYPPCQHEVELILGVKS